MLNMHLRTAMQAGTDTNCGDTYKSLVKAVKAGLIPRAR